VTALTGLPWGSAGRCFLRAGTRVLRSLACLRRGLRSGRRGRGGRRWSARCHGLAARCARRRGGRGRHGGYRGGTGRGRRYGGAVHRGALAWHHGENDGGRGGRQDKQRDCAYPHSGAETDFLKPGVNGRADARPWADRPL